MDFLKSRSIHASLSKAFFKSYEFFTEKGEYNLLAYLLSDQNSFIITVTRFEGLDKSVMGERISFNGESLLLTVQNVFLNYYLKIKYIFTTELLVWIGSWEVLISFLGKLF